MRLRADDIIALFKDHTQEAEEHERLQRRGAQAKLPVRGKKPAQGAAQEGGEARGAGEPSLPHVPEAEDGFEPVLPQPRARAEGEGGEGRRLSPRTGGQPEAKPAKPEARAAQTGAGAADGPPLQQLLKGAKQALAAMGERAGQAGQRLASKLETVIERVVVPPDPRSRGGEKAAQAPGAAGFTEAPATSAEPPRPGELPEQATERAREERAHEARAEPGAPKKERREVREGRDVERFAEALSTEESGGPATGWLQEAQRGDTVEEHVRGDYVREVLGDERRCRGLLEDGLRCLRRPVEGTGYCREHAVSVRFEIPESWAKLSVPATEPASAAADPEATDEDLVGGEVTLD